MAHMQNAAREERGSNPLVGELLVVRASRESLNEALVEHGIGPDQIISIVWQPGRAMAIGDNWWPKYRVIYRS